MKYIITLIITLVAVTATAQTTSVSYEVGEDHLALSYDYTETDVLFTSFSLGFSTLSEIGGPFTSATIRLQPFELSDKVVDAISLEPFAFFQYGYTGNNDTFQHFGFGVEQDFSEMFSISARYTEVFGVTAAVTIKY